MNTKVDEGKLISGKEALIALANGEDVEWRHPERDWFKAPQCSMRTQDFFSGVYQFRLKPRTITINGIEVPGPFLPEEGELFYHASPEYEKGYAKSAAHERNETTWQQFGAWRTEEEIKQVISALRFVLNGGWHEH